MSPQLPGNIPKGHFIADSLASMFSRFSSTSLGMEVVAYRDIEPGEELTFSCESPK